MKAPKKEQRTEQSLKAFTTSSRAHGVLSAYLAKQVQFPPILQGSGFPILEVLYHRGALSQCEIGKKILRTTGNISLALDKLEHAGLVARLPGPDRRSHTIELSDEGRALIAEWFPRMADAITQAFAVLSEDELANYISLSKKIGFSLQNA